MKAQDRAFRNPTERILKEIVEVVIRPKSDFMPLIEMEAIGDLLEALYGVKVEGCNWLYLILKEPLSPVEAIRFSHEQVRAQVRHRWKQFERWFELGRFQDQLPIDVRISSVVDAFDTEEFLLAFSGRGLTWKI